MKNLIAFIWKNHFFFLFLLLETFSVYLLVRNNKHQKAGFINSSHIVAGKIYTSYSSVTEYLSLKETNQLLAAENARLHSEKPSSYMQVPAKVFRVNDTVYMQQFEFISAKVVNNSTNRANNYLTLNAGSAMGVKPDMAVISGNGIVGVVKDVSENFCSVMSILHRSMKISSKIKKEGSFGPLSWEEGDNYQMATLKDIPVHVKLSKGDTIVTSAYSAIFPENIMVGTIDRYERKPGQFFYTVKIKLSTDFKKIQYVHIVRNLLKEEQIALENRSQNDQ